MTEADPIRRRAEVIHQALNITRCLDPKCAGCAREFELIESALRDLVAETQPQWQPIETCPHTKPDSDWSHVLVLSNGVASEAYYDTDAAVWVYANLMVTDEDAIVAAPTHWQPLPAALRQSSPRGDQ